MANYSHVAALQRSQSLESQLTYLVDQLGVWAKSGA
jgi:hypothetical protein